MLSVNIPTHGHIHNFDNPKQYAILARKNGDKYWCNRSELCMSLCWQTKVLYLHFKWKNTWLQTSPIVFQLLCMQARLSQGLKYQGLILFHWFLACDAILETYVQLIFSSFEGSDEKSRSGHWQLIWHQENMGHGQTAFQIFSFSTF